VLYFLCYAWPVIAGTRHKRVPGRSLWEQVDPRRRSCAAPPYAAIIIRKSQMSSMNCTKLGCDADSLLPLVRCCPYQCRLCPPELLIAQPGGLRHFLQSAYMLPDTYIHQRHCRVSLRCQETLEQIRAPSVSSASLDCCSAADNASSTSTRNV
jgi:hypothetical protein